MSDNGLPPAGSVQTEQTFALRDIGRRRPYHADGLMACIPAGLARQLEQSGSVLMKRPGGLGPSTSRNHADADQGEKVALPDELMLLWAVTW